jgi:hypothetical protein
MGMVLHAASNSEARTSIKDVTKDAPAFVGDVLHEMRGDLQIYNWKMYALRYIKQECKTVGEYLADGKQLKMLEGFDGKIPTIAQPLSFKESEKILAQAIKDVTPVIHSAWGKKVKFVDGLLAGASKSLLFERAVLTYRWEYPFVINPGACLNKAINNYKFNIIRDATSQRRMIYTGKKRDGDLKCKLIPIEDAPEVTDEIVVQDFSTDITTDITKLPNLEQKIISLILFGTESTGESLIEELQNQLQIPETMIRDSLSMITSYITNGAIVRKESGIGQYNVWPN